MGSLNFALNAGLQAANKAVAAVKNSNTQYNGPMGPTQTPDANGFYGLGPTNQPNAPLGAGKAGDYVAGADLPYNPQTSLTQQPAVAGIPQDTSQADNAARIQGLADAQKASLLSGLEKSRANSLASLNTEQSNLDPAYYDKRNQAAASSDVGALNFAQYMAARGIKGNAGAMPEIYRNAGLQGQIGALDQQQAQANAGIESQRGLVNTNYASDVASANAGVDAQTMQAQIAQYNTDNQYKLQQAQLALQKQQADATNTGYYNPYAGNTITPDIQAQLAPYANDYQAYIDANPNGALTPYAQNARYQKVMSDQTSQNQYGQQYQTVAGMQAATQNKGQELNNIAQQIQNSALPETLKLQTQRLMQQVAAGAYDKDQALAQLNQTLAQTNATNSGVQQGWATLANNAFNAQTDAAYKQGMLANSTAKTGNTALAAGKTKAMSYFDTFKNPDGVVPTTDQRNNLKTGYNTELNTAISTSNPLATVQAAKSNIISTYGDWTGNQIYGQLVNTLQNYTPGE